jgi:hypothetical protein
VSPSEITLVLDGEPKASIIAPSDGPLAHAANELQRYVQRMSKAKLPITTIEESNVEATKPPRVIFRAKPGVAKHDGYCIHVQGDDLMVEASEARGCIYGAYMLLEQLGCRFYGPAPLGVIVPKRDTLTLPATLEILREPAFMNRIPSSGTPEEQVQWGFNFTGVTGTDDIRRLIERLGLQQYRWGHIWPVLIGMQFFADGRKPEKTNYAGREAWLPVDEEGVRRHHPPWHYREGGESLCFSNEEAVDWFTDNAVNWVLTNCQNADYVSVWSADTRRIELCRCDECTARFSTGRYQYATDWYLHIHNIIRRKLNERGWHNIFGWITYHGSEEPPIYVDLFENGNRMDFLYAPRPRGGAQHGPFTNDHRVSVKYRRNLQAWRDYIEAQDYQGTRTVFEYYYDLVLLGNLAPGRAFLIPKHNVMQEDIRFYHEQGFDGFFDCNPPSNAWFPDSLSRWFYHRLMWDLDVDLKAARADFFQHYYGAAARAMQEMREAVERLMFGEPSQKVIDELRALEAKSDVASGMAGDDDVLVTRIEGMRLWVHYCALCKESELHEKVTHDKEKGQAIEHTIRKLLNDKKDFLVNNGFMNAEDVAYVAGDVVDRHLRMFK